MGKRRKRFTRKWGFAFVLNSDWGIFIFIVSFNTQFMLMGLMYLKFVCKFRNANYRLWNLLHNGICRLKADYFSNIPKTPLSFKPYVNYRRSLALDMQRSFKGNVFETLRGEMPFGKFFLVLQTISTWIFPRLLRKFYF